MPETVHTPVVADMTATVNPELEVGATEKVPLPRILSPGFVNEMFYG